MTVLSIQLTKEDFYQFSYYTSWAASWNSRKRLIYYFRNTLSAAIGSLLGIYLLERTISLTAILVVSVFLLVLIFVALPAWVKRFYRKHVEKFSSNPSNSSVFLKTQLTIDEKGIESKDDVSTTMHSWAAFVKKVETKDSYYLYLGSQLGLVIPKRTFASQKEKVEFENILLKYFPLQAELEHIKKAGK